MAETRTSILGVGSGVGVGVAVAWAWSEAGKNKSAPKMNAMTIGCRATGRNGFSLFNMIFSLLKIASSLAKRFYKEEFPPVL
jgi:hypothetical protein